MPVARTRRILPPLLCVAALVLPSLSLSQEFAAVNPHDLKGHWVGYFAIILTIFAYIVAMTEDLHQMSKAKPMVLGSALVWFAIFIYYSVAHGPSKAVSEGFELNLMAYVELFLFIMVSMTFLNTMTERGIFDALRIVLVNRQYSYRQLFWITGVIAFLLATVISSLTVGLLMGYIILAIGHDEPEFVGLAGINAVVAANAGGTMSPLGGISTFFVWQQDMLHFWEFFQLTLPCIVNFAVPAALMHFSVSQKIPMPQDDEFPVMKRGSRRIILIFVITLSVTIYADVVLLAPPIAGMMFGLALLQFFAYYLTKSERKGCGTSQKGFDVFKCIAGVDWDTLLFFYGAMMIVGALNFLGYMDELASFLFDEISPTMANVLIGISSSCIDNGTLMFAVLNMHPDFPKGQWLLLTLTLGVGGSLLAIGSAPGLHVLGLMKRVMKEGEGYTFTFHLRWMPAVFAGFIASIFVLYLVSGAKFPL